MKKATRLILLLGVLAALLCVSAMATDPEVAGLYGLKSETGVTITPVGEKTSAEISGKSVNDFYAGAEKLTINYAGATSGKEYMLLIMSKETTAPQDSDIVYIDQKTAGGSGVSFTAYPSALGKGTYYVYLSSDADSGYGKDGLEKVGSFESFVPYKLGDVDDDTYWTANDALYALQIAVNKTTLLIDGTNKAVTETMRLAADVDVDKYVTANDALLILQKAVGKNVF